MGRSVQAGAVVYELLQAPVAELRTRLDAFGELLIRLEANLGWQLPMPFRKPAGCFHGGAFFDAIGNHFGQLERRTAIVNADVLDAWFPPSPNVLAALQIDPGWLCRTSPPTDCAGLIEAIAHARGVAPANILPGAGSSDLIFRAFLHWLRPHSRVVLLDPTYGEYAHVLERVVGCQVTRVPLPRDRHFQIDLEDLLARHLADDCDLLVLVNPNSPTGQYLSRAELTRFLAAVPRHTRVWIDETYIDYVGQAESVEPWAARSENVIVCKSMSKVYALSGLRVAYLSASPHQLESLKAITPPWIVGLPAQLAAVRALQDPAYYARRYQETHELRRQLARDLAALGLEVVPGCANFLLAHLPTAGPTAAPVIAAARTQNVFLRDAGATSTVLGPRTLRVAVKGPDDQRRILAVLEEVLACAAH